MNKREKLIELINENGLYDTSKMLGISILELVEISGHPIDNGYEAYDVIYEMMNKKLVPRKYKNFNIGIDTMVGSVVWTLSDEPLIKINGDYYKEYIETYATPFWDGENNIPIDTNFYRITDNNNKQTSLFDYDLQDIIRIANVYFETLDDLENWYKGVYLPGVHYIIMKKHLPEMRIEMSEELKKG